jgi:hypothetical protein
MNAIAFEVDYERELLNLWEDIHSGRYQPGRSIAFVVNKPVKREIFAADFRDRVVHHLVINKLNPLFERIFIKGVNFLGVSIKPHRIICGKRTKGNFYDAIIRHNALVLKSKPSREELAIFLCSMNSYLGIMKHYSTYRLRKRMLIKHLSAWWWNLVYFSGGCAKLVPKQRTVR